MESRSNCVWASSVLDARYRPVLNMSVTETTVGTKPAHDVNKLRAIAEAAYYKYDEIRLEYTNMEDYVRWNTQQNVKEPRNYSTCRQYRVLLSTNGFLAISTNRVERFGDIYHTTMGMRTNSLFDCVNVDHDTKTIRKLFRQSMPTEFKRLLSYGSLTGSDVGLLSVMWQYANGPGNVTLWDRVCASGNGAFNVITNETAIKCAPNYEQGRPTTDIEVDWNKGESRNIYVWDRSDGRMLLRREEASSTGLYRIDCSEFVPVGDSQSVYPSSVIEQRFDQGGTQVMFRAISVRMLESITEEQFSGYIKAELDATASYKVVDVESK